MNILVLHGANLNMFGRRDPEIYGTITLDEINRRASELAHELGARLEIFQTNAEGEMIGRIHAALDQGVDAIVVNAGAWTHYSHALADALAIYPGPKVEVHMSNIHNRESFRGHSVLSPVVSGSIAGFGVESYLLGLRAAAWLARGAAEK